jgi:hypothetical protein
VCDVRASLLVLAAMAVGAEAAAAQGLPESVRACASETDYARRLACYDREFAHTDARSAPLPPERSAPLPAERSAPLPAERSAPLPAEKNGKAPPEEKFGYRGSIAREELDQRAAADAGVDRLEATVAEISSRGRGQFVVTLDNGQVWAQKTADSMRLKIGDRVVIRKASLGSFLLVAPNKRTTRVIRER